MGLFGFDDKFAMFDITPVENQFILEYMPSARGDFVKVYLYGLEQCYHPRDDMSITQMSDELNMDEADVLAAYRHWERRGLVRRVADNPPAFRYINVKQHCFMRSDAPDPAYESFSEALYAAFGNDRRLHGKEIAMAYEWVEDLGLPPEVVLMLMQHMISIRGKNFSFKAAQKMAVSLAEEHVKTIEDAESVLSRNKTVWDGSRRVLRRMGKRRDPSEDEMAMYLKWIRDYGYTADAIEAACAETTKGDPNFAYLDGILRGMLKRAGNKAMTSGTEVEKRLEADSDRTAPLKKLLAAMNNRGLTVNDTTLNAYEAMRALYADDIILLAGQTCALQGRADIESVSALLQSWYQKGLSTREQIEAYIAEFNRLNTFALALFEVWGQTGRPTAGDRALCRKWLDDMHLSNEMVLFSAGFAKNADKPMPYLDKLLSIWASQGIVTPEAAAAANAAHQAQAGAKADGQGAQAAPRGPKVVREQQYTQRPYEDPTDLPDWMRQKIREMNGDA